MFENIQLVGSIYSLIPPLLTIFLALITQRVLLSLIVGILIGALMIHGFNPMVTLEYVVGIIIGLVWDEGLNTYNILTVTFLFMLGIISVLLALSGGVKAFADWMSHFISNRRRAQSFTGILGLLFFIDDYFNCLAVGNISRPITDKQQVSRAKLAYVIDSTAAPICVMSPISSWGAYIIGIIGSIMALYNFYDTSALMIFVQLIPMHFYAIFAIIMVHIVAFYNLNIGPMYFHEKRALHGKLYDRTRGNVTGYSSGLETLHKGRVSDMLIPMSLLVTTAVMAFFAVGLWELQKAGLPLTVLGALEKTNPAIALFSSGLLTLVITLLLFLYRKMPSKSIGKSFLLGSRSMLPAIKILLLAWLMVSIISDLGVGNYLAALIHENIMLELLPMLVFVAAGFIAFATGTSWATFGVMLPIAAQIAFNIDSSLLVPLFAAVLSGAVAGDHCSPISDTTVLSSAGAGSHHIDHVLTQLPYGLLIFTIAAMGYLTLGFTGSVLMSFAVIIALLSIAVWLMLNLKKKLSLSSELAESFLDH